MHNDTSEILSQALALLLTVFVGRYVVHSLDVFVVRFSDYVQALFHVPHASKLKWYLANIPRFIVGCLGLIVAFFSFVKEHMFWKCFGLFDLSIYFRAG